MKKRWILTLILFGMSVPVFAQGSSWIDQMTSGRNITGPFHRPVIVKNEYGTDDRALLVFQDTTLEMYVPDVTDNHGYERLQELDQYGTYTTMLYMYDKKSEKTITYLVGVNYPKKQISIRQDVFAKPAMFTFTDVPYGIGNALSNTTKIMRHEIALHKQP